jgi:hypothetical protein
MSMVALDGAVLSYAVYWMVSDPGRAIRAAALCTLATVAAPLAAGNHA